MRLAFFLLLFANAAYFAWARWIDSPPARAVMSISPQLPQLELVEEAIAAPSEEQGRVAAAADPQEPARCVSVGPFEDLAAAARAAATLAERGHTTRQRAEQGGALTSYWVYIGGLASTDEQTRVLQRLERGRIRDAQAMPETAAGRRVSVGLFSDREGAERRARAVESLGLDAEIAEQRQTGASYWIDFELPSNEPAITAEGLLEADGRSRIEIRACPGTIERPARPAAPADRVGEPPSAIRVAVRLPSPPTSGAA